MAPAGESALLNQYYYILMLLSLVPKHRGLSSSSFHLLSVPRVKTHAGT